MTVTHSTDCNICGYHFDVENGTPLVIVHCNVRAFLGEPFRVWRCSRCQTIHCYDIVDLSSLFPPPVNLLTHAIFGSFLSYRIDTAVVFHKPIVLSLFPKEVMAIELSRFGHTKENWNEQLAAA